MSAMTLPPRARKRRAKRPALQVIRARDLPDVPPAPPARAPDPMFFDVRADAIVWPLVATCGDAVTVCETTARVCSLSERGTAWHLNSVGRWRESDCWLLAEMVLSGAITPFNSVDRERLRGLCVKHNAVLAR